MLQADSLAKKVTKQLTTRKSNSDLNNDFRDWTQREELFYKRSVLHIAEIKAIRIKLLKKNHDDSLVGNLATKNNVQYTLLEIFLALHI